MAEKRTQTIPAALGRLSWERMSRDARAIFGQLSAALGCQEWWATEGEEDHGRALALCECLRPFVGESEALVCLRGLLAAEAGGEMEAA